MFFFSDAWNNQDGSSGSSHAANINLWKTDFIIDDALAFFRWQGTR